MWSWKTCLDSGVNYIHRYNRINQDVYSASVHEAGKPVYLRMQVLAIVYIHRYTRINQDVYSGSVHDSAGKPVYMHIQVLTI